jgi:predicted helicase
MATFSRFLKSIYRDGNDGKQFERFVKWFLAHDPEWKTQVEKVWLWDDWPGRWGPDKGIDLVFRHRDGEMWAVQAKCYGSSTSITKEDMDTFLSESNRKAISRRLLMASTDKMGANAREVCAGQEKPVTHFFLSDFEKAAVDYPSDYKHLNKGKRKAKPKPHNYQETAIADVAKGFKKADRGQLIMACGTGKTFTTLWIKERLKSKNTLVLLPSLNLLAQTLREWTSASKSRLDVLCVCSDKSVGKRKDDEAIQALSEVPFPVHSNGKEIRKFLKGSGDKVIFSTYQSSDLVAEAQKGRGLAPFDLVIADEAHRCAISGKLDSPFATVLDAKNIKASKRLFATATPRTYTTAARTAAEERGVEVVGMDNEEAFGKPFHILTFGEAIKRKPPLLTDYQVVIVGVDNAMIARWIKGRELVSPGTGEVITDAETLASQVSLLKAMKDYKLQRIISFHNRVKRAEEFSQDIYEAMKIIPKRKLPKGTLVSDYVSGAMSTSDRGDKLKKLKNTAKNEIGLLANARCLSEGVDVPSLDGVAFIDPKNSQVDIIQAVGRAIRLSKNKSVGTIVLPVFIEDGEDAETRIEESNFQPVWWVLNALKAHDDVLTDELDAIRTEMGNPKRRSRRKGGIPKVVVDLPVGAGKSFSDALITKIVEQTTASWYFWFGLLDHYVSEFKNPNVPGKYTDKNGFKLGVWVNNQRRRYKTGILYEERIEQLEKVPGWIWDAREAEFQKRFACLMEYFSEHGHYRVPRLYIDETGNDLGNWCSQCRADFRKGRLPPERIEQLEAVPGWAWKPHETALDEGFVYLEQFVSEHGHARVPTNHETVDGFKLGVWVDTNRQKHKSSKPSSEHSERFEALPGWVWNAFQKGTSCLRQYISEFGHSRVPRSYKTEDGFKLA